MSERYASLADAALSVVVVPARDEQDRIGDCLAALAEQTVATANYEVILVADACADRTEEVAMETAAALGLALSVVQGEGKGPGFARRLGMDLAAKRLESLGMAGGLIATTDADTRPAADWLQRQLEHVALGASVIAGMIELDPDEAAALPTAVLRQRDQAARRRLHAVRSSDPRAEHHHFGGASIGVTASTYRRVGGLPQVVDLEDEAFARELVGHGVGISRPLDVRVRTAARTRGRSRRGLSTDLAVWSWSACRRQSAEAFPADSLSVHKGSTSVSIVIFGALRAARQVGEARISAVPFDDQELIDEVIVADASDARRGGTPGKGDAIRRAIERAEGDMVCVIDAALGDLSPRYLSGLLGPLLLDPTLSLVNASFPDRPTQAELTAGAMLKSHYPLLAGLQQPLAQTFCGRRELLAGMSFPVDHGVEIAVLLDALNLAGLDAIAETRMGARPKRAHPLPSPRELELAITAAANRRLDRRPR